MSANPPTNLPAALREAYASLALVNSISVNDLIEKVSSTYPDLVEAEKVRLFRDAMNGRVRKLMKQDASRQIPLPLILAHETLPDRIPLRPFGKKSGPAEWIIVHEATYSELDRHVSEFEARPKFDRKFEGLQKTRDYLKPLMAEEHRNEAIGPFLTKKAKEEKKASAGKRKGRKA